MKKYFLYSSFFIAPSETEAVFIEKISNALNCSFHFIEEDEDGDKYWRGSNLGFHFSLCKSKSGKLTGKYSLNIGPILSLIHDSKHFNIDFHFIELLKKSGINEIVTNDEMKKELMPT